MKTRFPCALLLLTTKTTKSLVLPSCFPPPSRAFATVSGNFVCRYALGGAARSQQPGTLPSHYVELLVSKDSKSVSQNKFPHGAPFLFYYNPHRYPAFLKGIQDLCSAETTRHDLFVASGGAERSDELMEERLHDALLKCGGDYLDLFIIEYVCPYEWSQPEIHQAIRLAQKWKEQGRIRYVGASTHSHEVGRILAETDGIDTVMLRYNMSHKNAAERLSFPACKRHDKPVLAFTTTRWNSLQDGHMEWDDDAPTTGECISFALSKTPPIEVVLHSARDENELIEALRGCTDNMSQEDANKWRDFGDLPWNRDGFDEYPQE